MRWLPQIRTGVIHRLDLQPGDRLIITFQRRLSVTEVDRIMTIVRDRWHIDTNVNPIGILDDGADITVARDAAGGTP